MAELGEEQATISAFMPRHPRKAAGPAQVIGRKGKLTDSLPHNEDTDAPDSEHNSFRLPEVEDGEPTEDIQGGNLGRIQRTRPLLRDSGPGQFNRLASDSMPRGSAAGALQRKEQRGGLRSKWAETTSKVALTATTTSHLAGKGPLDSIKENRREDSEARRSRKQKGVGSPVERSAPISFNVSIEDFFEVFMREDPGIRKAPIRRPQSVERDSILITGNKANSRKSAKPRGIRERLQEILPGGGRQIEPHEGSGSLPDVSRSHNRSNTQRLNKSTDRLEEKSLSRTNNSGSPLPIKLIGHNRSSESHSVESPVGSKQNSSELSGAIKGLQNQAGPSFISQQVRDRLTSNVKFGVLGPKIGLGLWKRPNPQEAGGTKPGAAQPATQSRPPDFITIENSVGGSDNLAKKVVIHDASDKFLADTSEVVETNRTNKTAEQLAYALAPNPRRFCIIENYMVNTTRPLSKLLVTSIRRFKETLFSCEKDVYEKIGLDPKMIELLAQQPFLQTSGMQRGLYLQHLQSLIETMMNALRHSHAGVAGGGANKLGLVFGHTNALKSKEAVWSYSKSHPLRNDVVYSLARKLFNPHSIFLVLIFYMRVLLAADAKEKCLSLGKILLSLSYVLDSELCRVEAYSQLGHFFEKYKDHETALFCFTRAMQHCWDCKAAASKTSRHGHSNTSPNNTSQLQLTEESLASLIGTEVYLYDKIGVQLYNLNELRLARLYHERMLSGFLEPVDSNAMIRSKEILVHETLIFNDNFLVRSDNYLDKYRVISSLLTLNTPPFDEVLTLERDENDNPMILSFIETVLSSQVMNSELNSAKKSNQVLQLEALLRHKERLFSQKENESSQNIGEVQFTADGRRVLKDGVEYIQKVTTFLENRSKNQSMRVSHQRDINAIFNFLSSTHNSDSVRVDYEKRRTMALENAKKYSVEDFLVFLTRARYYVIKKLNDLQPKKPDRNQRKFTRRSVLGDAGRLRSRTEGR